MERGYNNSSCLGVHPDLSGAGGAGNPFQTVPYFFGSSGYHKAAWREGAVHCHRTGGRCQNTPPMKSLTTCGSDIAEHSNTVLGDIQYPTPQVVKDFIVVYSDTSACTVQWTAPYANNIYDKVTEYDIRYANGPVDADDPKIWNGLKRVTGTPAPLDPGALQGMTISGLSPNKEYYIYLKAVKVNYGISYSSGASDPVRFRTLGSEDTSKAYRIPLSILNLSQQHAQDQKTGRTASSAPCGTTQTGRRRCSLPGWRLPDRSVQPVRNVCIFLCAEAAAADGASRLWMESRG